MLRRAALSIELPNGDKGPPKELRLFSFGTFRTSNYDGMFTFDAASANSVLAKAKEWNNEFHFDYEHAALSPGERGAPAACWFGLELRDDGLWAVNMRWSPSAEKMLKDREYRYWSPVFTHDDEGHVLEFINGALTNLPATHGMEPLAASRTAALPPTKEQPMKTLLAALRLADTATEAEGLAALSRVQEFERAVLSLTGKSNQGEALAVLQGFKQASEQVAALSKTVAEMETEKKTRELEQLIEKGQKEGKLAPGMVAWAKTQTSEALIAFLSVAPKLIPERNAVAPRKTESELAEGELSASELAILEQVGADPKLALASKQRIKLHGGVPTRDQGLFEPEPKAQQ